MSLSVLIVDDSEADQFLFEHTLMEYDSSVVIHQAYDGQEAISLIDSGACVPDRIFLDINMPRMGGIEFLEAYKKLANKSSTVIVMLSSSICDDDYKRCMAYPYVERCLPKPLSADQLASCFLK